MCIRNIQGSLSQTDADMLKYNTLLTAWEAKLKYLLTFLYEISAHTSKLHGATDFSWYNKVFHIINHVISSTRTQYV
jgi:hypothetical protein